MSDLSKITFYTDKLGNVSVICKGNKLYEVIINKEDIYSYVSKVSDICIKYKKDLENYLIGVPIAIDINQLYIERVSSFYQDVYRETLKVPYGIVTTYKEIAQRIGRSRAYRAVATALRRNPFPVFVPCHRIIRSDGKIGGRNKKSFLFRRKLLDLERRKNG